MIPSEIPLIGYKKILYTTGLREQSRFAFHHAASLSRAYQAQLTVFHVVPGDDEMVQRLLTYVDEKLWQQIKSSKPSGSQATFDGKKTGQCCHC